MPREIKRREFMILTAASAAGFSLLRGTPARAEENGVIWSEDFENGFNAGAPLNQRGWTSSAGSAEVSATSVHGGKLALQLTKPGAQSWAQKSIGEKQKVVWVDAFLKGAGIFLSVTDAKGKPVILSSTELGFFSASDMYAHRRVHSNLKAGDEDWRRVTARIDVARGRWDFYLNTECVFQNLLILEGSDPTGALALHFQGLGFADDISVSTEPPQALKPAPAWLPAKPQDCLLRVAQISDTHLNKAASYLDETRRVIADLLVLNPDLVIHTGDVCDKGDEDGLLKFKELTAPLKMPVHCIRGNHELMNNGPAAFEKVIGKKEQIVDVKGVRFILTDNATDGVNGPDHMGVYGDDQVAWMAEAMEKSPGPIVLAGHVPLLKTEKAWFVVKNQDKVLALIKKHGVFGYMCGHLHRPDNASVSDGFIHGVAMPVSGAYVPPIDRCKGFAIWDVFKDRAVMHHTPMYSAFRPREGFKSGKA